MACQWSVPEVRLRTERSDAMRADQVVFGEKWDKSETFRKLIIESRRRNEDDTQKT